MEFIAGNLFVWLITAVISGIVGVAFQIRNMKGFFSSTGKTMADMVENLGTVRSDREAVQVASTGIGKFFGGFVTGMIPVAICGIIATVSGVLFIVAVIASLAS